MEEQEDDLSDDPFIAEGCATDGDTTDDSRPVRIQHQDLRDLNDARQHREDLKRRLFRAKGVGADTSDSDTESDV